MNLPHLLRTPIGLSEPSRELGSSASGMHRLRFSLKMPFLRAPRTTLLLAALIVFSSSSRATIPEGLNKLLETGQYEAAYVLGASQLAEQEGDPEFDFAYGQAALNTGHYLEAVFALERVTTLKPAHHAARLALGKAYEGLGSFQEASKHYRSLLSYPEFGEQASAALERKDKQSGLSGQDLRLWVDFSGGFDSNVNLGSGQDGVLVNPAAFPATFFPFPDSMQAQSARFHETRIGADFMHQASANRALDAYLSAGKKQNLGEDQFDQGRYALNTGYRLNVGEHAFRIAARYVQDDLNDKRLRYVWGVTGEYRAQNRSAPNSGWGKSLLLGISKMEYPKQRNRDADQTLIGVSGNRKVGQILHRLHLYLGDEHVDGDSDYLGRRFASIGWHTEFFGMPEFSTWVRDHLEPVFQDLTPLIYGSVPFIELGFTRSRNRSDIPTLNERRLDRIVELKAGTRTRLSRRWELRLELEARQADSNIEIYDHKRNLIRLGIRYDLQ